MSTAAGRGRGCGAVDGAKTCLVQDAEFAARDWPAIETDTIDTLRAEIAA